MADGKIKLNIDVESKKAQKELSTVLDFYKKQKKAALEELKAYEETEKKLTKDLNKEKKELAEVNSLYEKQKDIKRSLELGNPNFLKAKAFAEKYRNNKGLVRMNLQRWGVTQSDLDKYRSASQQERTLEGEKFLKQQSVNFKKSELDKAREQWKKREDQLEREARRTESIYDAKAQKAQNLKDKGFLAHSAIDALPKTLQKIVAKAQKIKEIIEAVARLLKISSKTLSIIFGVVTAIVGTIVLIYKFLKLIFKLIFGIIKLVGKYTFKIVVGSISAVFKTLFKMLKRAKKKISGFFHLVKRSILMGIMRPLRAAVAEATQYLGKMLVANTGLANSLARLKGSVLTAFEPIYNVVVPAITSFCVWLARAVSYVSELISLLTGLAKASKKNAEALSAQAGEAESLFAAWDTIQQLESKKSDETIAPLFDFEDVKLSDALKKIIKSDDWTKLGKLVQAKINKLLTRIDTWLVKRATANLQLFANRISSFLNGAIAEALSSKVNFGTILADAFDSILYSVGSFANKFSFTSLGSLIAANINSFFANFGWEESFASVGKFIAGLFATLKTAVLQTNWAEIGQDLAKAIFAFDIPTILKNITDTILGLADGIITMLYEFLMLNSEKPHEEQIGPMAANFVNHVVDGILSLLDGKEGGNRLVEIVTMILKQLQKFFSELDTKKMSDLCLSIAEALKTAIDFALQEIPWYELSNLLCDFINDLLDPENEAKYEEFKNAVKKVIETAFEAAVDILSPIVKKLGGRLWEAFLSGMKTKAMNFLGIPSKSSTNGKSTNRKPAQFTDERYTQKILRHALFGFSQGGVVNPGHEFAAILGDNKYEKEIVSPLSTMKQAFIEAMNTTGGFGGGEIVMQVDGDTFARVTMPYYKSEMHRVGVNATGGGF